MTRRWFFFIPLLVFILTCIFCWRGLGLDPRLLPSTLINKPLPKFAIVNLTNPKQIVTAADFKGKVTLLNVWATWCESCAAEHMELLKIAQNSTVNLVGLDYKDDKEQALAWLMQKGNPYRQVLFDQDGKLGIELGVYGTPETFIIDSNGIVRYKYIGPLTEETIKAVILPIIDSL